LPTHPPCSRILITLNPLSRLRRVMSFCKTVATAVSLRPSIAPGASPFTREGPPSSEVTVEICRVPWPEFSQAPEDFLLAHLSRFAVRAPHGSTECGDFLGSRASVASGHTATTSGLGLVPPSCTFLGGDLRP